LACISEVQANGKIKSALLFSTDIHLPPEQIVEYYQARFHIEFIFWGGDNQPETERW
jgi:hypothetical protein